MALHGGPSSLGASPQRRDGALILWGLREHTLILWGRREHTLILVLTECLTSHHRINLEASNLYTMNVCMPSEGLRLQSVQKKLNHPEQSTLILWGLREHTLILVSTECLTHFCPKLRMRNTTADLLLQRQNFS